MTRGTHQVGAFALGLAALTLAIGHPMTGPTGTGPGGLGVDPGASITTFAWPVGLAYILITLAGGLAPDLDKPRQLWGRLIARLALGGHRHFSHSLLGFCVASFLVALPLSLIQPSFTIPLRVFSVGFSAGYLSHLLLDSLTVEGVPWLYPWGRYFGLPPWSAIRIRTGSLAEQLVVVPGLLLYIGWLGYLRGGTVFELFR